MQTRQNALNKWLQIQLENKPFSITPVTNDASFRRYSRIFFDEQTRIVMDAPPDKEKIQPFMLINDILKQQNVITPTIHAYDLNQGFMILNDLGDTLLLQKLKNNNNHVTYYTPAIETIIKIQFCPTASLPIFDNQYMQYEMNLFPEWFLKQYLNLSLTDEEEKMLKTMFDLICSYLSKQPQLFIHRDYHSRNLMVIEEKDAIAELGVIDFQDAMLGPITYDLVSLLKDCYFKLPANDYLDYAKLFYQKQSLVQQWSFNAFLKEVDICGLQRHLKVLGIFCRLNFRDNKPNYLKDLPLPMEYIVECLKKHEEFAPLFNFIMKKVLPRFKEINYQ